MAFTTAEILKNLGPLAALAGVWEGEKGDDVAPSDDRGTELNKFRERMTFVPFGPADNHEQRLFGLRYTTTAWRLGEPDPFHEELGYWLWDAAEKQVMRCFLVPRGITVLAGGTVEPDATSFSLSAEVGSSVFGICSNPFLDREFKTVKYDFKISITTASDGTQELTYSEDSQLQMPGKKALFHHIDKNKLKQVERAQ